jgi:hypothetical protein
MGAEAKERKVNKLFARRFWGACFLLDGDSDLLLRTMLSQGTVFFLAWLSRRAAIPRKYR